eukprot:647893-Rhodomonas_salina.1
MSRIVVPARFARGPTAELTKAMTWNYLAAYNAYLLFNPSILRADYSHGTIPVIETQQDLRNLATAIFWLGLIALGLVGIVKASLHPPDPAILLSIAFLVCPIRSSCCFGCSILLSDDGDGDGDGGGGGGDDDDD